MGAHLLGIPAVLLFGLLGYMIERSRRVSPLDAWIFVLFGYYLAGTGVGTLLNALVQAAGNVIGSFR